MMEFNEREEEWFLGRKKKEKKNFRAIFLSRFGSWKLMRLSLTILA